MLRESRLAVIDHAARWASNMLSEVQHNHGAMLGPTKKMALKAAITALGDYVSARDELPDLQIHTDDVTRR